MTIEGFKYRLQGIIEKELSVNAFAKKCECTEGALRSYLAGKSLPGLDKLLSIAKAANVSVEWLATGERTGIVLEKFEEYQGKSLVVKKIDQMLEGMDEEAQRDVLKYTAEKKQLATLLAEKLKGKTG